MAYPMNTTAFRQALAFAINDTEVRDVAFSGFGIPGNTGAGDVPNSSVFYNPSQTTYEYDTAKAISLLGTMGITKGADGFLHYANGTDVTLTIWADNSLTSNTISAQIVQTDLQDLGFKVSSQILDAGVIRQYAKTDQFGAFAGNAILLHTSNAQVVGSTYAQAIPWWDWNGFVPQPANNTEVLPLSDNSAYWSNYSAFAATANLTADNQYLSNIQAIRARDLPMIPLVYAPALFAVNTAKWSNWPASNLVYPDAEFWNFTALATVTPAVASSSSSTSAVAYPTIATAMVAVVVIVAGTVFGLYRRRSGPNG